MASSVLASQLKKLALARGGDAPLRVKGKPSLLYEPREAADINLQTIFEVAQTGIFELSNLDGRFVPYQKTLFGTQTLTLDREQLPPDEDKKLKATMAAFLRLLSGYLLLNAAHQALEYLIRLYKVQVFDVDPLLRSLLAYHHSPVFVRLLQLCHITSTPWQFLEGVQQSGSAVPREALVQRCTHDHALLDLACQMALDSPPSPPYSRSVHSFAAVLLLEALAAVPSLTPSLLARLLPYVVGGLSSGASEDAQAAALMLVMQLANRTTLSGKVLDCLVGALTSGQAEALAQERLMVLLHITQTQPTDSLSLPLLTPLLTQRKLEAVGELSHRFATERLVKLLLSAMLQDEDKGRPLLVVTITSHLLPLQPHVPHLAKEALSLCFHLATGEDLPTPDAATSKPIVHQVVSALEQHHSALLGPAMAPIMGAVGAHSPLMVFLQTALEGSLNVPLPLTGFPLLMALECAEVGVREAALRHLAGLSVESIAAPPLALCVERRLQEEEWGVVDLTLAMDLLLAHLFSPPRLLSHLKALATRCVQAVRSGRKGARQVLKRVVVMVGNLGRDHPHLSEEAALTLMPFLLLLPKTGRLTRQTVLPAAAALNFPPFGALPQPGEGEATDAEVNQSVVHALVTQVVKGGGGGLALWRRAVAEQGAVQPLFLLLLLHLVQTRASGMEEAVVEALEEQVPAIHFKGGVFAVGVESDGVPPQWFAQVGGKGAPAACAHVFLLACRALASWVGGRGGVEEKAWVLFATHLPSHAAQPLLHQMLGAHTRLQQVAHLGALSLQPHTLEAMAVWLQDHAREVGVAKEGEVVVLLGLLLVALTVETNPVRTAALRCVALLAPAKCVAGVVGSIGQAHAEVAADKTYLRQLIHDRIELAELAGELTRQALMLPSEMRVDLLRLLESVGGDVERAEASRDQLQALLTERHAKDEHMTDAQLTLMELLLRMYTLEVARSGQSGVGMEVVAEALEMEGGSRPQVVAAAALSPEVFDSLSSDLQFRCLAALLVAVGNAEEEEVRVVAREALGRLHVSLSLLQECLSRVVGGEAEAERLPTKKKKKKTGGSTVWPPPATLLPTTSALLEFLLVRDEGRSAGEAAPLLPHLHQMLESILDGQWASNAHPILSLLLRLLAAMAPHTKGSDVRTDLALRCLKEAEDPSLTAQATSLLTALLGAEGEGVVEAVVHLVQTESFPNPATLQRLLTAVLPLWAGGKQDKAQVLQVVVDALPPMPPHHRMDLLTTAVRAVGQEDGLPLALLLLLNAGMGTDSGEGEGEGEWAVEVAEQLLQPLPPHRQLSLMAGVLRGTGPQEGSSWQLQQRGATFVANHLMGVSAEEASFAVLLDPVLQRIQGGAGVGEEGGSVLEAALSILSTLTHLMAPSTYLGAMKELLQHPEEAQRRRVVMLLMHNVGGGETKATSRGHKVVGKREEVEVVQQEAEQYGEVAHHLVTLLPRDSPPTLLAVLQALTLLVERYGGSAPSAFAPLMAPVALCLSHKSRGVSLASMRCLAAIGCAVGPAALPWLPQTIPALLSRGSVAREQVVQAVERLVVGLGAFLSPYLPQILALIAPQPPTPAQLRLRHLLPQKIPARVLLDPLLASYPDQPLAGEGREAASVLSSLAELSGGMDRAGALAYGGKIYSFLLNQLDTRRKAREGQGGEAEVVESATIEAMTALVLKLSETSFKPLFVAALEWTQRAVIEEQDMPPGGSMERNRAFFGLVIALTEKLRSVFVPYHAYLLDLCIAHLTAHAAVGPKKKKKRKAEKSLSWDEWQLRVCVLRALHSCFLYDTVGFLDAPRFQRLLDPIVAQVDLDPPTPPEGCGEEEGMESTLVSCLGQMALTSGSDVLWKQLNSSVLMCTRSDKPRARRLALNTLAFLVDRLKEEYLVLLPETLPFLAEVLEDTDAENVGKAQALVKKLEEVSGEDLAQYL